MPQLNPASFPSQLFWLMASFVLLYVLLARMLLPRVQSVLATRKQTMDSDVEQAGHMKSQAERAHAQYEKTLAEARLRSQAMFAEAQADLAAKAAKRQAEMDAQTERKLAEAEGTIRAAKQAVLDKLTPVSQELAALIVETLVHARPAPKDVSAAISGLSKEPNL